MMPLGFQIDAQGPYIFAAPNDDHDYSIDWAALLIGMGEAISTVVWTIPADVTEGVTTITGTISTVWLTTSTIGTYFILATLTSNQGRIWNRGFRLIVTDTLPQ